MTIFEEVSVLKLLMDLIAMGPAVAEAVTKAVEDVEAATDTTGRIKAALAALEAIADAIRSNL